jgi:UDP-glucose 4-epimerase
VEVLAQALIGLFGKPDHEITQKGVRHGEKLYESLLSAEESVQAVDFGGYFKVPLDTRDLNYGIYFEEGHVSRNDAEAYTSHNTEQLSVEQTMELLKTLPEVRNELMV